LRQPEQEGQSEAHMLRSVIKTGTSRFLHCAGIDRLLARQTNYPVVFGYHKVVPNFPSAAEGVIPPMLISSRMFEQHLDWIGQRYSFISLDDIGSTLEQGKTFQRPVAAVTFDDGYRDIYHNALPILKRKGIPAAVFVVTGSVGTSHVLAHDKLYSLLLRVFSQSRNPSRTLSELLRPLTSVPPRILQGSGMITNPFEMTRILLVKLSLSDVCRVVDALESRLGSPHEMMDGFKTLTWPMLAEMNSSGFTIGSHTRSHILLTNEHQSTIQQELEQSRLDLSTHLGIPINHFSYPDGRFTSDSIRAVAAAGYRYAYTTCKHHESSQPQYTIPRTILWENSCVDNRGSFSQAVMSCHLSGFFDLFSGCDQDHTLPLKDTRYMPEHRHMRLFAWNRSRS